MTPQEQLQHASRLLGQHKPAEALAQFQKLALIAPTNPFVRLGIATGRLRTGDHDGARVILADLRAAEHTDPAILNNLGAITCEAGLFDEGLALLKRGVDLHPHDLRLREDYITLLVTFDRSADAQREVQVAIEAGVRSMKIDGALSAALLQTGDADLGIQPLREACERYTKEPAPAQWLAVTLTHAPSAAPAQIREAHELHGLRLAAVLRIKPKPRQPRRDDPDRPLRLAFISGDFHRHSVAYFLLPLVAELRAQGHDVRGYAVGENIDDVTARFAELLPLAQVRTLSTEDLVRRIKNDRVDVIVELGGLTQAHRHGALLHRCAPVQATYLGWPSTTGNPSVDFRLIDTLTDPPGTESHNTEELVRLDPCFLCYRPPDDAPDPAEPPAGRPFTFGSFNAQTKIHAGVIAVWARILREVPGSRLIVKNGLLANEPSRELVRARFLAAGMDPARFELIGWAKELQHHLSLYDRVDLALDTFPYNGTTTTCEALHMGVPVLSLVGDRHAARVGLSLLTAVGMTDHLAHTEDEYVAKAVAAAKAGPRSKADRLAVRARLAASPLRDEPAFARRFAEAVRAMWKACVVR